MLIWHSDAWRYYTLLCIKGNEDKKVSGWFIAKLVKIRKRPIEFDLSYQPRNTTWPPWDQLTSRWNFSGASSSVSWIPNGSSSGEDRGANFGSWIQLGQMWWSNPAKDNALWRDNFKNLWLNTAINVDIDCKVLKLHGRSHLPWHSVTVRKFLGLVWISDGWQIHDVAFSFEQNDKQVLLPIWPTRGLKHIVCWSKMHKAQCAGLLQAIWEQKDMNSRVQEFVFRFQAFPSLKGMFRFEDLTSRVWTVCHSGLWNVMVLLGNSPSFLRFLGLK